MNGLTARQLEVLETLERFHAEHGYPPTLRELGAMLGIRTAHGVISHLRALERHGAVTRRHGAARGVVSTRRGIPLLELEDINGVE